MKLYLKISFAVGLLTVFYAAYVLASGNHTLYADDGNLTTTKSYLPIFKQALAIFIFCGFLKLYIELKEKKTKITN